MKQVRPTMVEDRLIQVCETNGRNDYFLHHVEYPADVPLSCRHYGNIHVFPGIWLLLDESRPRFQVYKNLGPKAPYNHSVARMQADFPSLRRAYSYISDGRVEYEFTLWEEFVHFRLLWTRIR